MDRDTGLKPGDQAVVTIAEVIYSCGAWWANLRVNDHTATVGVRVNCLRPLPTQSATAQRVVEAAMAHRRKYPSDRATGDDTYSKILAATDAHLASLRPADPLAVALGALRDIAEYTHEHGTKAMARAAIPLIEAAMKGEG